MRRMRPPHTMPNITPASPCTSFIRSACLGLAGLHGPLTPLDKDEGIGPERVHRAVAVPPLRTAICGYANGSHPRRHHRGR